MAATANVPTVGVLAATPDEFALLLRLARAIDHENGMRILPMQGKGPVQTLTDLVSLKGIDAALVSSDTLAFMERNGLLEGFGSKISFILRLSTLDVHVIARSGIETLADLDGKTVAIGPASSDSYVAGQLLLEAAGASVRTIEANGATALRAVTEGKADAAILVGRKPLSEIKALQASSELHLLDVAAPEGLQEIYAPSLVTHEDYPQLIGAEHAVETVSAALVIAVFNWQRGSPQYDKVRSFTDGLFSALQPGGASDASLNLAASVPGWARHRAVEEALKSHEKKLQTVTQSTPEE
ncbi:MAG TPA: TAXI family TRAP transporter solute-binding subunit [Aestuariivirga sp.]|nr:TAXI family TRAP transporter solute-binding subunit [Aestuariivirga sp.]